MEGEREERTMTWLTSVSLARCVFRGHWSRLTDVVEKKEEEANANRLSKESNTLTARLHVVGGKRTGKRGREREREENEINATMTAAAFNVSG